MVVLAQALVSQPKILLVDELSLGLAPVVVKRLVPTLEAVAANGVGVLLIEQFAHVALGLAENAYVLEGGRIRYRGPAQRLKDEPELLRSAYLLRDMEQRLDVDSVTRRSRRLRNEHGAAGDLAVPELLEHVVHRVQRVGLGLQGRRVPAAWSWSSSQRSIQVPTRLPTTACSLTTSAGDGIEIVPP